MPLDHAHCMRIALDEARRGKAEGNVAVVTGVLVQACADIRQGEGQTRSGQGLAHGAKERHRRRLRWQQSAEALWEHGWGWEHRG
jgi:hypothetical protein